MKKKRIIIGIVLMISCAVLCWLIVYIQNGGPNESEGWADVAYLASVNGDVAVIYTQLDGECEVESVPNIEGVKGNTLTTKEGDRLEELFYHQEMEDFWYGIYSCEKDEYSPYEYDVIIDMGKAMFMIDMSEGIAYYLNDKEEPAKLRKFDLSDEQKDFIADLSEVYNLQ